VIGTSAHAVSSKKDIHTARIHLIDLRIVFW